tara:strand:+ start:58 stop:243 length:186 start_codon:yes stop_codon:yes gene_type:complete
MYSDSYLNLSPGVYVVNKNNIDWGIGQIQSAINEKITINFENVGKKVVNINEIKLKIVNLE